MNKCVVAHINICHSINQFKMSIVLKDYQKLTNYLVVLFKSYKNQYKPLNIHFFCNLKSIIMNTVYLLWYRVQHSKKEIVMLQLLFETVSACFR